MAAIVNKRVPRDLPTGQISMSQVNEELGHAPNTPISLGQANVRALAGVPTGEISMSDLQGKIGVTHQIAVGFAPSGVPSVGFNGEFPIYGALSPRELLPEYPYQLDILNISQEGDGTHRLWLNLNAVYSDVPTSLWVRVDPSQAALEVVTVTGNGRAWYAYNVPITYYNYWLANVGNVLPVTISATAIP